MKPCLKLILIFIVSLFASCVSNETKEKINEAGNETGQTVGKFVTGITHGVENALVVKVELSQILKDKGIEFGKITVTNDSEGKDNLLNVYVIFNKDFKGTMFAKAFDAKGLEMGRAKITISGNKEEARFVEFHFDKHTKIESDSRITIE
jgi:hypothetical protein